MYELGRHGDLKCTCTYMYMYCICTEYMFNTYPNIRMIVYTTQAINESLEGTGAPVQVVSGYLGRVTISVPWSALMSDSCRVEVTGLTLSVMPCIGPSLGDDFSESARGLPSVCTKRFVLLFSHNDRLLVLSEYVQQVSKCSVHVHTVCVFYVQMDVHVHTACVYVYIHKCMYILASMQMAEEVLKSGPVDGEARGGGGEGEGRAAFEGMEALAKAIETGEREGARFG